MVSKNSQSDMPSPNILRELRRAGAFGAGRDQQNRSSRFHDVGSRGHTFDALVISEVERVSGRGGDHGVHRFLQRL